MTMADLEELRKAIADGRLSASAESVRELLAEMRTAVPDAVGGGPEQLVRSNFHLVVAEAKFRTGQGVAFLDLLQTGYAGLQFAARKYEPTENYSFAAYAGHWIETALNL